MDFGDIERPWLLYLKAGLFLILGATAVGLILVEQPQLRTALLLAVAIWGFCRAYYFAFYVLERYVDADFRFAGLLALLAYLWRKRRPD